MPRRENSESAGLREVTGRWGDVVVGSALKSKAAGHNDVWDVVDIAQPAQHEHGMTGWFRMVNRATGEIQGVPPQGKVRPVTFMVPEETVDPDIEKPKLDPATQPDRTPYPDADQVGLLVAELGATEIAYLDHETGIWTCPAYEQIMSSRAEVIAHLEVAHAMDISALEDSPEARATLHGQAHSLFHPAVGKGGFTHQHIYKPGGLGELD
jgi:hypothetical protein